MRRVKKPRTKSELITMYEFVLQHYADLEEKNNEECLAEMSKVKTASELSFWRSNFKHMAISALKVGKTIS